MKLCSFGSVPWLLADNALSNLAGWRHTTHTLFTYHRTWETGLGVEIRVAAFSPDFYFWPWGQHEKVSYLRVNFQEGLTCKIPALRTSSRLG